MTNKRYAFSLASLLVPVVLALPLAGCAEVDEEKLNSASGPQSNVERTEADGVVTGSFLGDSTDTQILVGAGEHSETAIEMTPGTIAVNTSVTMQDGSDLGSTLPTELALDSIVVLGGTTPLAIGANQSISNAFTIALPLPLAQAKAIADANPSTFAGLPTAGTEQAQGMAALTTMADAGKLGLLYMVKTPDGNKVGLHILGVDDLVGTIIRYKGCRLGWIRLVFLSSSTESVEKDTTKEPGTK